MSKISVLCEDLEYRKHISDLLTIFYLVTNIEFIECPDVLDDRDFLKVTKGNDLIEIVYKTDSETHTFSFNDKDIVKDRTKTVKRMIFQFLNSVRKLELPWGFLTGVRPVKMMVNMLLQGHTREEAGHLLESDYLVTPKKANLLLDLAEKDLLLAGRNPVITDSVSLYVSIPFCPDRCTYCSFTSYPYGKYRDMCAQYVDCLIKELNHIQEYINTRCQFVQSIYIGGGTPGVLPPELIDKLLDVTDCLCTERTKEVTFEAGRPEVFDDEKQKIVKNHYVTRICINPQSMDDDILKNMGRNHTVKDIYNCFDNAVKNGFDNINTDMIVGLPGETLAGFPKNLKALLDLGQQSVTVHTLAMKKKSVLMQNNNAQNIVNNNDIDAMIGITETELKKRGFEPYYLYRQKMSVGNRENTGYSKKGYECIYNIQMIGERQTVLGAGAGATGRFVSEDLTVKRCCNKKFVELYINDVEQGVYGY